MNLIKKYNYIYSFKDKAVIMESDTGDFHIGDILHVEVSVNDMFPLFFGSNNKFYCAVAAAFDTERLYLFNPVYIANFYASCAFSNRFDSYSTKYNQYINLPRKYTDKQELFNLEAENIKEILERLK